MGIPEPRPKPGIATARHSVVNDFSLMVATANGTGSQTANLTLLRTFFMMGIPVHGKNIFPSNIQGLPTWYHVRVSRDGHVARKEPEVLVAFNLATLHEDVSGMPPGSVCILNGDLPAAVDRDDLHVYALPVKELIKGAEVSVKLRDYIANMVYVGALAHLLDMPLDTVEGALSYQFGGRQKLIDPNMGVVRASYAWAQANLEKRDPFRVEPMEGTDGLILMTGNEAGALGAVYGGVSLAAWYPITPSTSFIDALRGFLPQLREDEGGATYAVVQAEDELAAIGMILGAGWAGARALTATSGPGISLMSEFAGLGYFAEIPAVIWDIQRVGPRTGLPTRTGQGDVTSTYYLGHGDTKNVLLFPSSIEECFEFGYRAFDLADELQTPVFVLSDLDLGMNNWMGEPFTYPDEPMRRGKVLSAEEVGDTFSRYRDVDGDGVAYRTLPGNENMRSAYFTRGTGHNEHAVYSERADDWTVNMERLERKFATARRLVPGPEIDLQEGADVGILAFGSTRYAIEEARASLGATSYLRLKALPIGDEVRRFVEAHRRVVVVEMNRDGQLFGILQTELPDLIAKLHSVAFLDGMPFTADWVAERLAPHLDAAASEGSAD
jgi:2-oxoglutarate ferredoxin oxidoreductase subunit alpha